jgi:hypothetical protein
VARRPRFRSARLKQDLKSYARLLVDAGLVLGVCGWGYCVYREVAKAVEVRPGVPPPPMYFEENMSESGEAV